MSDASARRNLSVTLVVVGLVFVVGVYVLMQVWPSGWQWQPAQPEYEQMILGVYATLGVFLLLASRDPLRHESLIRFTAWSSVVHGGIMLVQALADPAERGHLVGDVPALIVVGVVLGLLLRRAKATAPDPGPRAAGAAEARRAA